MIVEFPRVFTEENFQYPENYNLSLICADGLIGWANCMSGQKPPEYFGIGMVKISNLLGIEATPEELEKYLNNF